MTDLFHGERVRLTALTAADLPDIARWFDDAEFQRLFDSSIAQPKSRETLERWLNEVTTDDKTVAFATRLLDGQAPIGYVALDDIEWQHGTASISLGIGDRRYWEQGYGRETLALLVHYAFQELNLHRVEATVFDYNPRSLALFEKAGFQREGVYRELVLRDGQRHDLMLYGLLRREWLARQPGEEPDGA